MNRRNQDRARRARNAVTHAQQQADELAVRAEQEQAHREQARVRQNAEQLSAATNKALESLEAAGFPGAVMVSCEERITEGIFTKRTKIKVVQEPGWSLHASRSGYPSTGLHEIQYYLLARGDYYVVESFTNDAPSGNWWHNGRATSDQLASRPQADVDAILQKLNEYSHLPPNRP